MVHIRNSIGLGCYQIPNNTLRISLQTPNSGKSYHGQKYTYVENVRQILNPRNKPRIPQDGFSRLLEMRGFN